MAECEARCLAKIEYIVQTAGSMLGQLLGTVGNTVYKQVRTTYLLHIHMYVQLQVNTAYELDDAVVDISNNKDSYEVIVPSGFFFLKRCC